MLKNTLLFLWSMAIISCGSSSKQQESSQIQGARNLVALRKKSLPDKIKPLKGKFLDYIYMIHPDHKQPGYGINTFWLGNGYAYGEGPYDGHLLEFYLFRGKTNDLVLMQESGYEVQEGRKFGYIMTPYFFEKNKMTMGKLADVFPVGDMDKLFVDQTEKFKISKIYIKRKESWSFFNLIRLPLNGTTVELKICRDPQEEPFLTESPCALIGRLEWDRSKFNLRKSSLFEIGSEKY